MFPKKLQKSLVELNQQISLLEVECDKMNDKSKYPRTTGSPPVKDTSQGNVSGPVRLAASCGTLKNRESKHHPPSTNSLGVQVPECETLHGCVSCQCKESQLKTNNDHGDNGLKEKLVFCNLEPKPQGNVCDVCGKKSVNTMAAERNKKWSELLQQRQRCECDCQWEAAKPKSGGGQSSRASSWRGTIDLKQNTDRQVTTPRHESCFNEGMRVDKEAIREKMTYDKPWRTGSVRRKSPTKKTKPKLKKSQCEKAVECELWSDEPARALLPSKLYTPVRTINHLLTELKTKSLDQEARRLVEDVGKSLRSLYTESGKQYHSAFHPFKLDQPEGDPFAEKDNEYVAQLKKSYLNYKKNYETVMKEKQTLTDELVVREKQVTGLKNKEKEYQVLITNLRQSLESLETRKLNSERTSKDLAECRNKVEQQQKVLEALQQNHSKMQERLQKCLLENDNLRSQLRISRLEERKFTMLLHSRDLEIKQYRGEIDLFQKQIREQLSVLRSNPGKEDFEKAMDTIIKHSQVFSQTDVDSDTQGSRKKRGSERLMHSSPTSTKCSGLDNSWNRLSTIYDDSESTKSKKNNKELVLLSAFPDIAESLENFGALDTSGYDGGSSVSHDSRLKRYLLDHSLKDVSFKSCTSAKRNEVMDESGLEEMPQLDMHQMMTDINNKFQDVKLKCQERIRMDRMDLDLCLSPGLRDISLSSIH